MEEVQVSRAIDAPLAAVEEALSPRDIVEYAGTYVVWDVERTDDGWAVNCGTSELDVVLDFTETDGGFVYRQREGRGPFEEMYASLTLAEEEPVLATARSCFTFDMPLSWITDRIAAGERKLELSRLLERLALAAGEGGANEAG